MAVSKIGVVLVTYNRLDKLKITLDCFEKQEYLPEYILIVNNASTDGTREYLKAWEKQHSRYKRNIISSEKNTGGSGGFYLGFDAAMKQSADWIWVSDDDAFPEKDALKNAAEFLGHQKTDRNQISAICGTVINNGEIDLAHRKNMFRRGLNVVEEFIPASEYKKNYFELNCFSYVGSIINRNKLGEIGLTLKEYFLWWDDTEHSLRLSKVGRIYCVPTIKIHHDVTNGTGEFTWKTYYGFRNMADLYKRHFSRICYEYFSFKLTCKTYLMDILGKDRQKNKAIRCSLRDCRKGKFGIHEVYKPGWKANI